MTVAPSAVRVPFADLMRMHEPLLDEFDRVWRSVSRSARFIGGELLDGFERDWAAACDVRHCVGVANGTDALELALRALGVGPGQEVVVPANTFAATAEAVLAVGASPVFVDVDPGTLLVDPSTVAPALTRHTAAVIVVHLYGQAADVPGVQQLLRGTGAAVVEDCAQAHGARWRGRPVGGLGKAGCFSFYPGKNLGAFGDGGAVTTDDPEVARTVRQLADHGRSAIDKHVHQITGRNSRLDALQAGLLAVKARHLDAWNRQRRQVHEWYAAELGGVGGIRLMEHRPQSRSVHHLEVVRVEERERVRAELSALGVETGVHYPVPCHEQPAFAGSRATALPVTTRAARQVLSLPMHPGLSQAAVAEVSSALRAVVAP